MVAKCKIAKRNSLIQSHALIDSGCFGFAFLDETFARRYNLKFYPLKIPRTIKLIDGRPVSPGTVTHLYQVPLTIDSHKEVVPFFVTKLGSYPLVIGIPWLQLHDPLLRIKDNKVIFNSNFCKIKCCISTHPNPVKRVACSQRANLTNAATLFRLSRKDKLQIYELNMENITGATDRLKEED